VRLEGLALKRAILLHPLQQTLSMRMCKPAAISCHPHHTDTFLSSNHSNWLECGAPNTVDAL
jgi:hypothetical protein